MSERFLLSIPKRIDQSGDRISRLCNHASALSTGENHVLQDACTNEKVVKAKMGRQYENEKVVHINLVRCVGCPFFESGRSDSVK